MRILRKLQALSPLKVGRLLVALSACTFCLLGLKSMISLEAASRPLNISKPLATPDEDVLLQDGPRIPDKQPRNDRTRIAVRTVAPLVITRAEDDYAYPGWVAEPLTTLALPTQTTALRGVIGSGNDVRPVRGDGIVETPVESATNPIRRHVQRLHPGKRVFRTSLPNMFSGAVSRESGIVQQVPLSNDMIIRPLEPLPANAVNQPIQPLQPGSFAVGPGVQLNNFQLPPGIQVAPQVTVLDMPKVTIRERLVHFDLKGAPPLVAYYKEIFPLLKKIGATGLLMEYEDMFPFSGRLKIVNAKNGYTKVDIETILRLAKENGLFVIPLVQTFGHLEFVLKHKEFKHLREVEKFPQAVCPTRNGTFQLVQDLIAQTLTLHPDAQYLHIGADEVFHLGMCDACKQIAAEDPLGGKRKLFLSYIAQTLTHIRTKYPAIKPIMWDDMFHSMSSNDIRAGLGNLVNYVEPMIWSYFPTWMNHLPMNGDLYADVFPNIWGATAFKGSAGETLQTPSIKTQGMIHTSWIDALRINGHKMKNFRGIVLTGWSRYDHFYPLCELFPVSIPSLAINMQILVDGEMNLPGMQRAAKNLNCPTEPSTLEFTNMDPNLEQFSSCKFPGVEVFRNVHSILSMTGLITKYLDELEGKFPEYQMKIGYLQGSRVEEQSMKLDNYEFMLRQYLEQANVSFRSVFDESTLNEWEAANVEPSLKRLLHWKDMFAKAAVMETWPARPLNVAPLKGPVSTVQTIPLNKMTTRNPFAPIRPEDLARAQQLFF